MRNCLVLGSARSGTSMVAGLLANSGYNVGDDYLERRDANPRGFFEDEAVNRLNDRLLAEHMPVRLRVQRGGRHGVPLRRRTGPAFLARPPLDVAFDGEDEEIRRLVAEEPFAYKDPRLCFTLDAWRPHLREGTGFVCVFREPGRTVESMVGLRREKPAYAEFGLNHRLALEAWISSYRHVIDRHLAGGGDWLFVHYDEILAGEGVQRIERFLNAELDSSTIDPSLKRSADQPIRHRPARSLYQQLLELACESPLGH